MTVEEFEKTPSSYRLVHTRLKEPEIRQELVRRLRPDLQFRAYYDTKGKPDCLSAHIAEMPGFESYFHVYQDLEGRKIVAAHRGGPEVKHFKPLFGSAGDGYERTIIHRLLPDLRSDICPMEGVINEFLAPRAARQQHSDYYLAIWRIAYHSVVGDIHEALWTFGSLLDHS